MSSCKPTNYTIISYWLGPRWDLHYMFVATLHVSARHDVTLSHRQMAKSWEFCANLAAVFAVLITDGKREHWICIVWFGPHLLPPTRRSVVLCKNPINPEETSVRSVVFFTSYPSHPSPLPRADGTQRLDVSCGNRARCRISRNSRSFVHKKTVFNNFSRKFGICALRLRYVLYRESISLPPHCHAAWSRHGKI